MEEDASHQYGWQVQTRTCLPIFILPVSFWSHGFLGGYLNRLKVLSRVYTLVDSLAVCPFKLNVKSLASQPNEGTNSFLIVLLGLQMLSMASFSVDLIGCVFISAISESAFPAELFHIGLISGALTRLAIWFLFWQMADRNLSISLVWKYTWVYKLTLWMLNGLVEKVGVYNAEKWTVCGSRGFVSKITMWEKARFLKCYSCQFLMWPSQYPEESVH